MRPIFKTISAAFLFLASAAQSEEAKFKILGDTLFYSTEDEGITKGFCKYFRRLYIFAPYYVIILKFCVLTSTHMAGM
jgi:hypothetical protein